LEEEERGRRRGRERRERREESKREGWRVFSAKGIRNRFETERGCNRKWWESRQTMRESREAVQYE
jgi:hypothetical protein